MKLYHTIGTYNYPGSAFLKEFATIGKRNFTLFSSGSSAARLQSNFRETVYFKPTSPRNSWYSFYQAQMEKTLVV